MIKVMFVCLGNICRSPMAEAVFQQLLLDGGLEEQIFVESSGTGRWHVGNPAHSGTRAILAKNGIQYRGNAQQISRRDYDCADYVVAMDDSNVASLEQLFGGSTRLSKLLDYASNTEETDVPDPYYGGGFDHVYELVVDGCHGLLATIRQERGV